MLDLLFVAVLFNEGTQDAQIDEVEILVVKEAVLAEYFERLNRDMQNLQQGDKDAITNFALTKAAELTTLHPFAPSELRRVNGFTSHSFSEGWACKPNIGQRPVQKQHGSF